MTELKITTLNRDPVELGSVRYYLPPPTGVVADEGAVIILEPVTRDNLGATDGTQYGSVRVITNEGVRVVDTVSLGVLVLPVGE